MRAREIVGIAGVDGNGQTELIDALTGLRRLQSGSIEVAGKSYARGTPRGMLDAGVGHIPEDRHRRGLVLEFSIAENIAIHDYCSPPASRFGWLYPRRLVARAAQLIHDFDVRGGGPHTRAAPSRAGTSRRWSSPARSPETRRC